MLKGFRNHPDIYPAKKPCLTAGFFSTSDQGLLF